MPSSLRDKTRLLLTAIGIVCALIAGIIATPLLTARTEPGIVEFHSTLEHGQPTNYASVVWRNGVVPLEKGDLSPTPRAGDSATVLAIGKTGLLKSGHAYRSAWNWAVGFTAAGLALIICGLFVIRPTAPQL